MQNLKKVQIYAGALRELLPADFSPEWGLVLGTGLGGLARAVEEPVRVSYADLPDFPQPTVPSHEGAFLAGRLAGVPVLIQQGRCHLYEGRTPAEVCAGVRVMGSLGCRALLITNAAGSINPRFPAGGLMLIEDHINMTGRSPLTGPNHETLGPRFPDMSEVYDPGLSAILEQKALELGIRLEKGVYFGIAGPQLETRAETRAYRLMGGDAVGMSTVCEVIAARHMGMRVAGVSCLSNQNLPDCMAKATIEEIIAVSRAAGIRLERLIRHSLPALAETGRIGGNAG